MSLVARCRSCGTYTEYKHEGKPCQFEHCNGTSYGADGLVELLNSLERINEKLAEIRDR